MNHSHTYTHVKSLASGAKLPSPEQLLQCREGRKREEREREKGKGREEEGAAVAKENGRKGNRKDTSESDKRDKEILMHPTSVSYVYEQLSKRKQSKTRIGI